MASTHSECEAACRAQGLGDSNDELRAEIDSLRSDVALLKSELAARCGSQLPVHSGHCCMILVLVQSTAQVTLVVLCYLCSRSSLIC